MEEARLTQEAQDQERQWQFCNFDCLPSPPPVADNYVAVLVMLSEGLDEVGICGCCFLSSLCRDPNTSL